MTDAAAIAAQEPDGAPRLASLDVMRGIAILGILFMNIDGMGAASLAGARWPNWIGGWTLLDQIVWLIRMVLADGTARCMLELLFGAGMVILTGRAAEKAGWWRTMRSYYWRNIVLFGLGMVHVFGLLWYGDILHMYALCALVVFPLRKLSAKWLILLGLVFATTTAVVSLPRIYNIQVENERLVDVAEHRAAGQPLSRTERKAVRSNRDWHRSIRKDRFAVAREDRNRTSSFARWQMQQIRTYTDRIPTDWSRVLWWFGEATCTMLIGAGLFKLGVLQGQRKRGFYVWMLVTGYLVGGAIRGIGAWQTFQFDDSVSFAWSFREFGRLAMTLGHVGLIGLLLSTTRGAAILKPFEAAGRTALTIYICQSLIGLWLLYPPSALGLYGKQGWAAFMGTAIVIDLVLLVAANLWVRHFRIAPVEWLWRSIVELRLLPFRKASTSA